MYTYIYIYICIYTHTLSTLDGCGLHLSFGIGAMSTLVLWYSELGCYHPISSRNFHCDSPWLCGFSGHIHSYIYIYIYIYTYAYVPAYIYR